MVAWEPIQETITYIENNLACDLNVEILAHRVYLSPYYFQCLFNRLVNKNIAEYIKLRRLAKAAKLLKESDLSILAIAIECGFQSHSHFTKVFKNVYTITPSEYRDSNIHLDFFVQPDLSLNYSFIEEGKPYIVDDMVIEINEYECEEDIQFIGKSTISLVSQIGEAKVNQLTSLWDDFEINQNQAGVDILTPCEDANYFDYFVGIESKDNPFHLETRVMPKGRYVVCRYEAEDFDTLVNVALYKASQYLYERWLPQHHLIPEPLLVQKYFQPFSKNCYIELWAKLQTPKI